MKLSTLTLSLLLASTACPGFADEMEQHGAHVHGEARLDLVLDGNTLAADLESPADSLVGFEHPPRNIDEEQRLADTRNTLKQGAAMLGLPADAGCRQTGFEVTSPLLAGPAVDAKSPPETEAHHADFDVLWRFECTRPEALTTLTPGLFAAFPGLSTLHLQAIGPGSLIDGGQRGATLSRSQPTLRF